jgi:glutamate dehydrogenase (NADP+)
MSNLPSEPEFEQAYKGACLTSSHRRLLTPCATELASTLENSTLFNKYPEYRKALQVAAIPERIIQFRVVWEDDNGQVRMRISSFEREGAEGESSKANIRIVAS